MNNISDSGKVNDTQLRIEYHGELSFVEKRDIMYIEALGWRSIIYTAAGEEIICGVRLSELGTELLGYGFCRCHRGYVINLAWAEKMRSSEFILRSGTSVPVGRKYKSHAKQCFIDFKEAPIN